MHHLDERVVYERDDRLRCFRGSEHTEPVLRLVAGHARLRYGRDVGQLRRTLRACYTQRAHRSDLTWGSTGAIELKVMFMWPASTSVTACGAPLYGTCTMSTPAICLKSSIA